MTKKYTVVTGASSGIGYETALAFAEKGKDLILVARREDKLLSLKDKILDRHSELDIIVKKSDLSDQKQVYNLYNSLHNYNIETWINNAGVGGVGHLSTANLQSLERLVDVNVKATAILSTLYAKDYANVQGAQLINVSSALGYVIALGDVAYSASKFFVSALTEGLAIELKDSSLKAKVLAPALTTTDFIKAFTDKATTNSKNLQLHSPQEVASYLVALYESDKTVGIVNGDNEFVLSDAIFPTLSM
jgi:short-subunit dehydrogenase